MSVVLPAPVPPEMIMFSRARTHSRRKAATPLGMVPLATNSSSVLGPLTRGMRRQA